MIVVHPGLPYNYFVATSIGQFKRAPTIDLSEFDYIKVGFTRALIIWTCLHDEIRNFKRVYKNKIKV